MTGRPFRFSVQAGIAASFAHWAELARRAEGAGFDALVVADHLGGAAAPFSVLAAAGAATSTLRLGTMVLNNDFHHPAVVAREVATLDVMSGGRAELGLGAGHARPEYEAAGIVFDAPGVRIARLGESCLVLRKLLDGRTVTHRGDHYRLDRAVCDPRPVQGHVPVTVGGGGDRLLRTAAAVADAVGFTGLGPVLADGVHHAASNFAPARVDHQVDLVRTVLGARRDDVELQALVQSVVVTRRPEEAAANIAARVAGLAAEDAVRTPYLLVGEAESIIDALLSRRERWGFSHYTVRADAIDAMVPVVAALSGR